MNELNSCGDTVAVKREYSLVHFAPSWNDGMLEYWMTGSWDDAVLGKWSPAGGQIKFKWIISFDNPLFHRSTVPLFRN